MNQVVAKVIAIDETDVVTYIRVKSNTTNLTLIKSQNPSWLDVGDEIKCSFQEGSVSVSKECPGKVSIENRIPATLKSMREGDSLCELTFDSDIGAVVSLITSRACQDLDLSEGCEATMLLRGIDANIEPILAPIDTQKYTQMQTRMKDANIKRKVN